MKNYRAFVPIVLIVAIALSWYSLVSDTVKEERQFNSYLTEAREKAKDGITKYAIENYTAALDIKNDPEIYAEVAKYYKDHEDLEVYTSWCEEFYEKFPTNGLAYDCVLDAYVLNEDYKSCFDVLEVAEKRNVSTDFLKKSAEQIKYEFKIAYNSFDDVGACVDGLYPVYNDGWGFVDCFGEQYVDCVYKEVGLYGDNGTAPVLNSQNERFYIDKLGDRVSVPKGDYVSFGLEIGGVTPAKKANGKYVFLNEKYEPISKDEYDFATSVNSGIGAVKKGSDWYLVDGTGKILSKNKYVDVIIDEKGIVVRKERLFVSQKKGSYIMIDTSGKQIGSTVFEDAHLFVDEKYAAVKVNGKWQFVDKNGKLVSDKKYDDARSFSNELAAVCVNGKWGFVDVNEKMVIKNEYDGAKDFNAEGSCFVKNGDKWKLLKLYRLNREE